MSRTRSMMPISEFWTLIDTLSGSVEPEAMVRLSSALRALEEREVIAFQQRLARALYDLDREELFRQPIRLTDDEEVIGMTDDGFVYLRAGIVALGRETYERVLQDVPWFAQQRWPECEELLYVAEEVLGDDISTRFSYETGANSKYWTATLPEPSDWSWPPPVLLQLQDMSAPSEGTTSYADGRVETFVWYPEPDFVAYGAVKNLEDGIIRAVQDAGGLALQDGVQRVRVVVNVAKTTDLSPKVGPIDEKYGIRDLPVSFWLKREDLQDLSRRAQRYRLTRLTAEGVLAALPPDHPARGPLSQFTASTDDPNGPDRQPR